MQNCIFDVEVKCDHNCADCCGYILQCESCGCMFDPLFDIDGSVLCLDCLIEQEGEELYADFVLANEEGFRQFVAEAFQDDFVCA